MKIQVDYYNSCILISNERNCNFWNTANISSCMSFSIPILFPPTFPGRKSWIRVRPVIQNRNKFVKISEFRTKTCFMKVQLLKLIHFDFYVMLHIFRFTSYRFSIYYILCCSKVNWVGPSIISPYLRSCPEYFTNRAREASSRTFDECTFWKRVYSADESI